MTTQTLLTPDDTATKLKVTTRFLQHDRLNKRTIPFIKINHLVRYDENDLNAFIEKSKIGGEVAQ